MKEVQLHAALPASQLTVSVDAQDSPTVVVVALESAPGGSVPHHWLLHHCDAQMARAIAANLIVGAELVEGTRALDTVQTDEKVEGFHEHG